MPFRRNRRRSSTSTVKPSVARSPSASVAVKVQAAAGAGTVGVPARVPGRVGRVTAASDHTSPSGRAGSEAGPVSA